MDSSAAALPALRQAAVLPLAPVVRCLRLPEWLARVVRVPEQAQAALPVAVLLRLLPVCSYRSNWPNSKGPIPTR